MTNPYTLAYSTCPNDTYIFHALVHGLISDASSLPSPTSTFDVTLADVETLNQQAQREIYDITKLSFAAFGALRQHYALLRTGAALGRGCGPLVVSLPKTSFDAYNSIKTDTSCAPVIAVPGLGTTAFVLFNLFLKDQFPTIQPDFRPMPFEKIMPAIEAKEADFGVIIHEGRFIYQQMGLSALVDLGDWWEKQTGLPIPLGCIAVKRSLGKEIAADIESLIGKSIDYAMIHPDAGIDYIKAHAQEMDDHVIHEHIRLYVNEFSRDLGEEGETAIRMFYEKTQEVGLIPESNQPLFAC